MVVSLAGLAGACCRASALLWIYLFLTGLLILAALCFAGFALAVTNAGAGQAVSGRGFREYRLGDYSSWLRRTVEDGSNCGRIRSCLVAANVCRSLQSNRTLDEFVNANLSPVQAGRLENVVGRMKTTFVVMMFIVTVLLFHMILV